MTQRNRYDAADRVARASLKLADCLAEFADLPKPTESRDAYCQERWDAWGKALSDYDRATSPEPRDREGNER